MNNRHSLQIKQLLEKKRLSKSRFNPESRILINSPSMKQSREIKKSQSSTSLHSNNQKQKHLELEIMSKRYNDLYSEYIKIAEEAKKRVQMCKKQQDQIYKYEKAGERDRKQIQRLKSMIGFIHKAQNGTQTLSQNDHSSGQFNFLSSAISPKKQNTLKQSRSHKEFSLNSNKKPHIDKLNDQNSTFNMQNTKLFDSKMLNKSRTAYPNLLNSKQFDTQKKLLKKFQSSKLAQSLLYSNKSSIDFRKKRTHVQKNSEMLQSSHDFNYSRVNSPNSRFKFIPSVDI